MTTAQRPEWTIDTAVPEWMPWGLCADIDPELFFPEKGGDVNTPKRICRDCPVKTECLEYALENDERFGIWGGTSENQRRKRRAR